MVLSSLRLLQQQLYLLPWTYGKTHLCVCENSTDNVNTPDFRDNQIDTVSDMGLQFAHHAIFALVTGL